jgi:pimeloyl-ACP methyl ester carboxylesterase
MRQQIAGRELGFGVVGQGPALVLLHPFPFDRRSWDEVAERLGEHHRVVTIDARGFGESALQGPYSIDDLAEDATLLLDHLGIPMATIVGLSMGGYVALALAERRPARVAGLVLCDTRAAADSEAAQQARQAGIEKVNSGGLSEFLDGMPVRLLSSRASDALKRRVRTLSEQKAEAVAAALAAMRDRPDRTTLLGRLQLPCMVMVGAEDTVTPPSEARMMAAEVLPGARFAEIAGAGHLSMLEQPEAFVAAMTRFLDDNNL